MMGTILFSVDVNYMSSLGMIEETDALIYEILYSDLFTARKAVWRAKNTWYNLNPVDRCRFQKYIEEEFRKDKIQFIRREVNTMSAQLKLNADA